MKKKLGRIRIVLSTALLSATALLLASGCASSTRSPQKSGFLSAYNLMDKVDDTTSRYVSPSRLAFYKKFKITATKCLVTELDGKPLSSETQQKVADYLKQAITKALSDRYPIVTESGPDVAEIRVAVTDAYKTGGRLGMTVEGEIVDSYSNYQAAAVMKTELSEYVNLTDWFDGEKARQIMDGWAARLRQAVDSAHGR